MLLDDLKSDCKSLIDKLYLLKSPRILSVLPRQIPVWNLQTALNEVISKQVTAILEDEKNACPHEIRTDLAEAICDVLCFKHYVDDIKRDDIERHRVARVIVCVPSLWKYGA